MREIKFRYTCKRENSHTFSRIFTLEQIESCEVRQWWELNQVGKSKLYKDLYTGLKDKNGREIYEGDIVSFKNNYGEQKGSVFYGDKGACFKVKHSDDWLPPLFMSWDVSNHELEVIGNIYENPEELK